MYVKDVDPGVADQAWEQFLAALAPLRQAGKLGALLFQFPPWFPISRRNKDYILGCAQRAAPDRVCVEFRNHIWMTEDNQTETLGLLADCRLPYVCVEMPRATGTLRERRVTEPAARRSAMTSACGRAWRPRLPGGPDRR